MEDWGNGKNSPMGKNDPMNLFQEALFNRFWRLLPGTPLALLYGEESMTYYGKKKERVMNSKGVVLLVEDQRGFRRIYEDVLSSDGYEVLTAEDGQIGWDSAKGKKPDVILLDLGLPKLSGLEVLQKIRADAQTRDIPVIIFSVTSEQADVDQALAMGANEYSVKGFDTPRKVLERIEKLLVQRKTAAGVPVLTR